MKNKLLKYVGAFNIAFCSLAELAGFAGLVASVVLFVMLQTGQFEGMQGFGIVVYFILSLISLPICAAFIAFGIVLTILSVKAIKYSQNVNTVDYKKKSFKKYAIILAVFDAVIICSTLFYFFQTNMNIGILIIGTLASLLCFVHFILLLIALKRNKRLVLRYKENQVEII